MPKILFEGDELAEETIPMKAGAGQEREQLPEAYGTGKLNLLARDPHSIYAYWDFTPEQLQSYNGRSADKHLVLLVWQAGQTQRLIQEIPVHADSNHWFVHVPIAGASYCAELGFYNKERHWIQVATSAAVQTPGGHPAPAGPSAPVFATIKVEPEPPVLPRLPGERWIGGLPEAEVKQPAAPVPMPEAEPWEPASPTEGPSGLLPAEELKETAGSEPEARAEVTAPAEFSTPEQSQREPRSLETSSSSEPSRIPADWGPQQAREILQIAGLSESTRHIDGSIEVVDLLKRWLSEGVGISSIEAMQFGLEQERAPEVVSSPGGPEVAPLVERFRPFWLNVNAELVIYGATESDALVTIGGRPIRLRPDGSFSYRFALPDGEYELPVRAVSGTGEVRAAALQFRRRTSYHGEVGVHPQDPQLAPPLPQSIPQ